MGYDSEKASRNKIVEISLLISGTMHGIYYTGMIYNHAPKTVGEATTTTTTTITITITITNRPIAVAQIMLHRLHGTHNHLRQRT